MLRRSLEALLVAAGVAAAPFLSFPPPEASSAPAVIAAPAKSGSPLLGIVYQQQPPTQQQPGKLVRVDPQTLQPLPGKQIEVGSGGCAPRSGGEACWTIPSWSFSPDRALLAVARNERSTVRSLQLIDVRRMRVAADVPLRGGPVGGLAWLARGRVLALQEVCCSERQRLLAIELAQRRVVARRGLGGSLLRLERTRQELVLLLAPAQTIGPATLGVADSRGRVRFVRLGRILAGSKRLGSGSDHRVQRRLPGLAVDPERRRAFIVEEGLVGEVDLVSLAVSYHELKRPKSLLARIRNRLEPSARAKGASGAARSASWLGGGFLVVSGADEESFTDARGEEQTRIRPAGLLLIDTRSWSVRKVDQGATDFLIASDLLLATGWSWDSSMQELNAIGLAAYKFNGDKRFQLFNGDQAWIARVHGGFAYVGISRPDGRLEPLRVVDLAAGRVVRQRRLPLPMLLLGVASSWWEG